MRFHILACDYDGTIAHDGKVSEQTIQALRELKKSGRKLLLVTGREIPDLFTTFEHPELFEWIVGENGAVLYHPASRTTKLLAEPPLPTFVERLKQEGVGPISVGNVIVATWRPHEAKVLEVIQEMALEHQIIFNKGAVMILPPSVNKGSGLKAALAELNVSEHNVVGVGDAENDHSFLQLCECSVAVANALPILKEKSDFVTGGSDGVGVSELSHLLMSDEKVLLNACVSRHAFPIGVEVTTNREERLSPYTNNILIAGSSGAGKSTLATTILEGLADNGYHFCIVDPEGDFAEFEAATVLGNTERIPTIDEIVGILEGKSRNAVVNMVGVPFAERPNAFLSLLSRIQDLRSKLGKPHWVLVDEAHHVLPNTSEQIESVVAQSVKQTIFVTLNPSEVHPSVMKSIELIIGVGSEGPAALKIWAQTKGVSEPTIPDKPLERGEVLVWHYSTDRSPFIMKVLPSRSQRRRHRRKYSEGELPPDRSFYFQGKNKKLNLRAQNLISFLQLGDGVDDATWLYHLKRHDFSGWFRNQIKDTALADAVAAIENSAGEKANAQEISELKGKIRQAVEKDYTLPAKPLAQ